MPTEYSALFNNSSTLPLRSGLQQKQGTKYFAFAIDLYDEAGLQSVS